MANVRKNVTIDEKELQKLLDKSASAKEMTEKLNVTYNTLQKKLGELLFFERELKVPNDLFPAKYNVSVSKENNLTIDLGMLPKANFKEGDSFKISCTEKRITLQKL